MSSIAIFVWVYLGTGEETWRTSLFLVSVMTWHQIVSFLTLAYHSASVLSFDLRRILSFLGHDDERKQRG